MLVQTRFCGYCEQPFPTLENDSCNCTEQEPIEIPYRPFNYSATALMEAQAFLDAYPEFKDSSNPLNSYRRIGAYDSPEQEDYDSPVPYDTDGFPIDANFLTSEVTTETEWDGIYASRDNYQRERLAYWRDVEPTRCTIATHWWSNRPNMPGYPTPYIEFHVPELKVRNHRELFTIEATYDQRYQALDYSLPQLTKFSFEELQGFAAETLIDFNITEKYQYRFFNIFMGNDSNLHVGLLTLDRLERTVTCSRKNCYFRTNPKPIPNTTDRSVQEAFVHDIIRHGNNHGPDWYVTRKDFAFIHAENCDATHSRSEFCNAKRPLVPNPSDLESTIDFLIRHRKFCHDSRCRCGAYYHTLSDYLRRRTLQAA